MIVLVMMVVLVVVVILVVVVVLVVRVLVMVMVVIIMSSNWYTEYLAFANHICIPNSVCPHDCFNSCAEPRSNDAECVTALNDVLNHRLQSLPEFMVRLRDDTSYVPVGIRVWTIAP
jgi:flagellar basal body-associated protein FliL